MVRLIYLFLSLILGKGSLRNRTWRELKKDYPLLYKNRRKRNSYYFTIWINKTSAAYLLVFVFILFGIIICWLDPFYSIGIIQLDFDSSRTMLSNGIEYTGGIVALSFVFITMFIERVKNEDKYISNELYRKAYLKLVFAISICTILFFIIFNLLSTTLEEDFVINLSILGSILMIVTVIAIARLFNVIIRVLRAEQVHDLAKEDFLRSARFYKLNELFTEKSELVYRDYISELGIDEQTDIDLLFTLTSKKKLRKIFTQLALIREEYCLMLIFFS